MQVPAFESSMGSYGEDRAIKEESINLHIYPAIKPRSKALAKRLISQRKSEPPESDFSSDEEDSTSQTPQKSGVNERQKAGRSQNTRSKYLKLSV